MDPRKLAKVQAFLSGLDIDISDARIVFTLLDVET